MQGYTPEREPLSFLKKKKKKKSGIQECFHYISQSAFD